MAQEIDFAKAVQNRKDKVDEMRSLCDQMRNLEETNPDYDPFENLQSLVDEADPELALLMDEDATLYPQATAGKMRAAGHEVSGSEFEIRRDEKAIDKEMKVRKKIEEKL